MSTPRAPHHGCPRAFTFFSSVELRTQPRTSMGCEFKVLSNLDEAATTTRQSRGHPRVRSEKRNLFFSRPLARPNPRAKLRAAII